MLFLPYSGRRYQLIDSKLINTRTGEPIPVVDGKCRLCWVDGDRDYDFPVIYYLCVTGAKVPDYLIDEMVVVFGDGDETNFATDNLRYSFRRPVECLTKPGFYYLPGFCNYVINEDGVLHSLYTNEDKIWTEHPGTENQNRRGGYLYASLVDDCDKATKITRHRAMLIVFRGLPNNWSALVCNHINGVKGDDRVDNLEWVTYKENNQHAIDSGLRNNGCAAILVKNIKDDTITRYVSMEAAAKGTGYTRNMVKYRVNKRDKVAYNDYLQFKKDDGSEWVELDFTNPEPLNYSVEITAYDVKNDKIFIFPNSSVASKVIGATSTQVLQQCYNVEGQSLLNGFYVRETKNFKKPTWTAERVSVLRENGYRNGKMCYVYRDDVLMFKGLLTDFSKTNNVGMAKLYSALASGGLCDGKYRLKPLE